MFMPEGNRYASPAAAGKDNDGLSCRETVYSIWTNRSDEQPQPTWLPAGAAGVRVPTASPNHSTVTDFARLRGLSTSRPSSAAM